MITFTKIRSTIGRHWHNLSGWHTNRKLIVFESDDWGSIRMPSKNVYDALLKKGIRVDRLSFSRYDSLASEEDLSALFDVLTKFKDKNGNHPAFTANCVVANPDFEKIRESNFREYHYEVFTKTLERYPKHRNSFQLWKEGMRIGVFHPQFHGREHLNVCRWMDALQHNIGNIRLAFDNGMFDLSRSGVTITEDSFMDSLSFSDQSEFEFINQSIIDGLNIFEGLFGYRSRSFVAPCYIWDPKQEAILSEHGVDFIQGGLYQKCPVSGKLNQYQRKKHCTGQKNNCKQAYLVRNCFFEPSDTGADGLVEDCLNRISSAFFWKKPAIISTHRLNYIGYIVPENRDNNLKLLKEFISSILNKFPDVEFMTSDQLGNLITGNKVYNN